jgi:hypothetical protein
MDLLNSYQYQGTDSYKYVLATGYNYWSNPNRKSFSFANSSEWNKVITPTTNLLIVSPINNGTRLFTGITDKSVNTSSITTFNPITVEARNSGYAMELSAANQGGAKLVNLDLSNNQIATAKVFTTGAGNVITLRYYTDTAAGKYYQVVLTAPVANTEYTFQFNPFNGVPTQGVVGTPVTLGSNLYNSGVANISQAGSPTGQIITDLQFFASTVVAGSKVSLVSLEANNNKFQQLGQPFAIKVCCFQEFTKELERTYNELKCGTKVTGKTLNEQKMTVTLKTKKNIELLQALGLANDISERNVRTLGDKQTVSPASNASNLEATVSNANDIVLVSVDDGSACFNLHRDFVNNTTATLDPNFFYVDIANNKIVLPNSIATYRTIEVYNWTTKLARVVDYYTQNNPVKLVMQVERLSATGVQTMGDFITVELGYPKMSSADDGDEWEFECTVLLTGYDQAFTYTY